MSEQGFNISPWAFRDLTYMFNDPILVDQLLLTDEKQVAKYKKVNKDGSITLGKTSISWLNRLFGGEYVLNPETICLRLIKIITGMGSSRNNDAYKDMCDRFSNYYKDGNYSLAISAIFVAYRFVLASDIKTMTEENSTVEKGVPNRKNVLLNGILVKDNSGQAVVVDFSNPSQVLFRRP